MTQYRKFLGEYEAIMTYLKRYQYIQGDINHSQEILASLSTSVQESIPKEMIKDRAMVQALDRGYIIPRLEILKLYIEQNLEAKVLIQQKEFSKPKPPEKKIRFEDESWDEALKQVKELTHKIKNPPQPEPQPRNEGKQSIKEVLNKLKTLSEAVNPQRRNWNNSLSKDSPKITIQTDPGILYHHSYQVINPTYQLKWLKDHNLNVLTSRRRTFSN
ncbi:hypothetical protein O181_128691 [Austropuccinia psidii MF-1]|uniref:Uncharacterized protein n=1 Tax=Austropuccinia psidii MF-1 TaxID=1389203 RepID=A0A9Q3KYL1_9BASI|nr:hypothetical protein [Austropuccinia psidii MF-1]